MYVYFIILVFFFKQKTAYEMRISDWSSDVCSSDLAATSSRSTTSACIAAMRKMRRSRSWSKHRTKAMAGRSLTISPHTASSCARVAAAWSSTRACNADGVSLRRAADLDVTCLGRRVGGGGVELRMFVERPAEDRQTGSAPG